MDLKKSAALGWIGAVTFAELFPVVAQVFELFGAQGKAAEQLFMQGGGSGQQAVVHPPADLSALEELCFAKVRQVTRDFGLGQIKDAHQITHADFRRRGLDFERFVVQRSLKQIENTQPGAV